MPSGGERAPQLARLAGGRRQDRTPDRAADRPERHHLIDGDDEPEAERRAEHGVMAEAETLGQPNQEDIQWADRQIHRKPAEAGASVGIVKRDQPEVRPPRREGDYQNDNRKPPLEGTPDQLVGSFLHNRAADRNSQQGGPE